MPLPKLVTTTHELIVPSTKQRVTYRPYVTREEKILLTAKESGKEADITRAVKQLIEVCVEEIGDAGKLTTFDFEYIFLKLRAVSSGESITPTIICDSLVDNPDFDPEEDESESNKKQKKCGTTIHVPINFEKLAIDYTDDHTNTITLTDDGIGVVMKYPTLSLRENISRKKLGKVDEVFEVLVQCIDQIYDANDVYHARDTKHEELVEFVDSLSTSQLNKIQEKFFKSMPILRYTTQVTCKECGKVHDVVLEGISAFFQ